MNIMTSIYLEDKLNDEYKKVYKKLSDYGMKFIVDIKERDDKLMDLLDLLLTAQGQGKSVNDVIGNDINRFAKNFFGKSSPTVYFKVFLKDLLFFDVLVLFNCLLLIPYNNIKYIYKSEINILIILYALFACILSNILGYIISKYKFKKLNLNQKSISKRMISNTLFIILIFLVIPIILLSENIVTLNIPLIYPLVISSVYLIVYLKFYIKNKMDSKSKNEINLNKSYKYMAKEHLILHTHMGIFNRKNKRLSKKGEKQITEEEYTNKICKRYNKFSAHNIIGYILIIIFIGFFISTFFFTKFDTVFDLLIYCAIQLPIVFIIFYFNFICKYSHYNIEKNIVKQCKEQGITMFEYMRKNYSE